MPNPFEPTKPSPLSTSPPLNYYPEFLPPSAFNTTDWPTWSSIEPSLHDLIANTKYNPTNNINAHARNTSTIATDATTPLRKRRPSKPVDGAQQHQADAAFVLEGERFGVHEVVEALRGRVEVERVMKRLREERRVFWCGGMGMGQGGDDDGDRDAVVYAK